MDDLHGLPVAAAIWRTRIGVARRRHRLAWTGQRTLRVRLGELLAQSSSEDHRDPVTRATDGGADVVLHGGVHPVIDGVVHVAGAIGGAAQQGRSPVSGCRRGMKSFAFIVCLAAVLYATTVFAAQSAQPTPTPGQQEEDSTS